MTLETHSGPPFPFQVLQVATIKMKVDFLSTFYQIGRVRLIMKYN